jgi:ABC-type transport system involved in cytochrome c biogenesis permease subunit
MTALNMFRWCNLALTFLLELAALAALSYAGAQLGNGARAMALAIAAPLVAVVFWQLFAAPRSIKQVPAAKVTSSSPYSGWRPSVSS